MPKRRISSMVLLLAASWATFATTANSANPVLVAYERGIEDPDKHSEALNIATLDVRVDIVGNIADTTVTAKFMNPSDEWLEGRFTLDLPPGEGYAWCAGEAGAMAALRRLLVDEKGHDRHAIRAAA